MYAKLQSASILGIDGLMVEVEADISNGLPVFDIVGLPDSSVKESKERVRIAIKNSQAHFPLQRITINLAPADVRKEGSNFDLAIALGVLLASEQLPSEPLEKTCVIGELSLNGSLRPLPGVLSMVIAAKQVGCHTILLPKENAPEAQLVSDIDIVPLSHLHEAIHYVKGEWTPSPLPKPKKLQTHSLQQTYDFADVQGQYPVKRALEVAAAGNHNLLLVGPPGSGKTMISKRLPTILPQLAEDEALEVTKIYSIAGLTKGRGQLITERPFRSPHHTISQTALVGGGSNPKPGEVSLAHRGVLFLDEMPEFSKTVLEVLRQPLEDGKVTISRAKATLTFPADILLIGSINPCPCGFFGYEQQTDRPCICTPRQVERYRAKLSGPLLDRIDIHIEVPRVDFTTLSSKLPNEDSQTIRHRVQKARERQHQRLKKMNAAMSASEIRQHCPLSPETQSLFAKSFDALGLSARAHDRILKVARTIADLEDSDQIQTAHIAEAIRYRTLDRKIWG